MNKLKTIALALFVIGISSCSTNASEEVVVNDGVKITRSVIKDADEAKCTAKIAVDGMSCSKMCTGAIASCLKKMEGVKVNKIYFDPERKAADFADVEFDQHKISEKEMIAAIEKLNNGQYKVKSVEIVVSEVSYEKIDDSGKKEEVRSSPAAKVTAFNNIQISVPGIFAILGTVLSN